MRADDPNLPHLRHIADPLADPARATRDVDAVVNASRTMLHRIEAQVAERGLPRRRKIRTEMKRLPSR